MQIILITDVPKIFCCVPSTARVPLVRHPCSSPSTLIIQSTGTLILTPPTPSRYGIDSASTLDYALIKNLNWPCTADSLAELSSDHNPIRFYFPRTPKFEIPPPQLNTTWSIFTKSLAKLDNFDLPKANSTQEIDSQVSNLTSEILNAHTSASRPFYHSEQPFVQGELKELIKDRNKARKTWQQTRHPQHKTELNRLQNIIKRKIYHHRQQLWEDNLSTLNAEDNSLWGIAKAFRKKTSPISALNGPTAVVVPILKPGKNSALAESYRPISLLPVLSKLDEKVILARLNDHLEREKILIPEQHGFRPRLSTSHQLLRVGEFIKEGNNKDECTAAVFLGIQKAFDRNRGEKDEKKDQYLKSPPPRRGRLEEENGRTRTKLQYVTRARMEERRKRGLSAPKRVRGAPRTQWEGKSCNFFSFFFCEAGMKKKSVYKEKLTDATSGVTKLEPALTLIPVLMRGKCI
ncbi:uncharacterized protein TNCV_1574761 [Trichonephila clavipes]|nr:uncharacterized protein TNCV_1574761 [Trichonephila clavipes]